MLSRRGWYSGSKPTSQPPAGMPPSLARSSYRSLLRLVARFEVEGLPLVGALRTRLATNRLAPREVLRQAFAARELQQQAGGGGGSGGGGAAVALDEDELLRGAVGLAVRWGSW